MTDKPPTIQVLAIAVIPFVHGIWCSFEGREPFVNEIVMKRWDEFDPDQVVFMLDSHNFSFHGAYDMVEVVMRPNVAVGYLDPKRIAEEQERFWASRPTRENMDLRGLPVRVQDAVKMLRGLGWACEKSEEP